MDILELKEQAEEVRANALCRVYTVSDAQKAGQENYAIMLPEQKGKVLIRDFWKSISDYDENVSGLLEISGEAMMEKWGRLEKLLQNAMSYERGNIEEIRRCDLCVCAAEYGNKRYYLCARQNRPIKTLLRQETVILENNGELVIKPLRNVRLTRTVVDFIVDMEEKRIIFLDSGSYEAIVREDGAKEIFVRRNLNIIDKWKFIANISFIKERVFQKNVYSNLYRIFNRQDDLERLRKISPAKFKWFLIHEYSDRITEADFEGEKLIITRHNMEAVLKILVKGIDIMWLERDDERAEERNDDENENVSEDETILPMRTIKMCRTVGKGFVLEEDDQKSREEQIRRFLFVLNKACESDKPEEQEENETEQQEKNETEEQEENEAEERAEYTKNEKQTTGIFDYFKSNDVKLQATINGKETWFEKNETDFQKIYADDDERELLIKGMCKDRYFHLLLSDTKSME